MKLNLLKYNNIKLCQKGNSIKIFNKKLYNLCNNMMKIMKNHNGMGLAAQQIGYPLNLFIIDLSLSHTSHLTCILNNKTIDVRKLPPFAIINPKIIFKSNQYHYENEGCLSFPNIRVNILRSTTVKIQYQDLNKKMNILQCSRYASHCIQHEIDHINGVLFTERMDYQDFLNFKFKIKKLKSTQ